MFKPVSRFSLPYSKHSHSVGADISILLFIFAILLSGCSEREEPTVITQQNFNADSLAPFVEPDFPFITTSVDARELGPGFPKNNVATRCLAIQLGNDSYACFDTDMLRWSVAWTGDFLSMVTMAQVSYRDFHNKGNAFPVVQGSPQIATGLYAGWSGTEPRFTDPRPPSPNPNGPSWGPIPQDLGRWNGVYLKGDDIVLSYTVNGTDILEKPGSIVSGDQTIFTRTFSVNPSEELLSLMVAERLNGERSEQADNIAVLHHGTEEDSVTAIGLAGATQGVEMGITNNRYMLAELAPADSQHTFTLAVWSGSAAKLDQFKQAVSKINEEMPKPGDGGPPYWKQTVHTKGHITPDTAAYVTDKLTLPIPNPWNRNVRAVDIGFINDHRAAVVTFDGDVWLVDGIEDSLSDLQWKRYASGLYEPQSVNVVDGDIFVFGREGIVRLVDQNGDEVADYYENFSNLMAQSMETREWPGSMVPAPDGGFYISKGGAGNAGPQFEPVIYNGFRYGSRHSGSVVKVAPDGCSLSRIATGLRMPYLGINPETGVVTASDQQGNFVPSSPLFLVDNGDYYGVPATAHKAPEPSITAPLLWFPHNVDPSGAGQVWVNSDKMGPLNGELVHLSYGRPGLFRILFDSTETSVQGAASLIPAEYTAPTMKGAISPGDGQMYIAGFSLWGANTEEISALLRVRYTGQPSYQPESFKVREGGILIRFDHRVNQQVASNPANYQVKRWNYKRTQEYGSGHYQLDGEPGEELLPVFSSHVSEDGKGIFLVIPDMREVMQMQLAYDIKTTDGTPVQDELWFTVNSVEQPDLAANGFPNLDIKNLALETDSRIRTDEGDQEVSIERGRELFQRTGCNGCHSINGTEEGFYGPTMQGLFGTKRDFIDSTTTVANEKYIRTSILQPGTKVVKGFGQEMPSFVGILSEREIASLILYIKSLSGPEEVSSSN